MFTTLQRHFRRMLNNSYGSREDSALLLPHISYNNQGRSFKIILKEKPFS